MLSGKAWDQGAASLAAPVLSGAFGARFAEQGAHIDVVDCQSGYCMNSLASSPLPLDKQRAALAPDAAPQGVQFEPEFVDALRGIFEKGIPFNQLLGLEITQLQADQVQGRIAMRPELVGHAAYQRIHGGVISAGLDSMGGLAVMVAIATRHMDDTPLQRLNRFARLGTIDMRVDYLRPGIGNAFVLRAEVLRLGSRVANTRMEFLGADGSLLSTATAAYIVS